MTWSWAAFGIGIACSFLISFGAIVGWWFILMRKPDEARKQMDDRSRMLNEMLDEYEHERRN